MTLSGVGGVGKTRLALAVGAELAEEFPDGVWLVELAPVGDADAVPDAIATALGITPQGGARVIDTVAEALAGRRVLVVVDNCEHLLPAAADAIAAILARSDVPRVLATSREHLRAPGEALLTVSPLAVDGVTSDAVALFVERARGVRPGFGIFDEQTADAVIRICETLDGLPLGIELAAARMAAMSAVEVRDRLDQRLRLLTGPELGPDRQATLRHTVAWSYDLLDDEERATLRTASAFAGGFDLPALCAVAEASDDVDVLRVLDSLVRKSLVIAHHGSARTRYSLFETIRAFVDEQLGDGDERQAAGDRHASYFAGEAARRWERWNGPEWRDQVDWVQRELANLRSAYRWSLDRGQVETATDVAAHAALMGFSVELFETIGWAEAVLPAAEQSRRPAASPSVRRGGVRLLRRAGRGRDRERAPGHRAGGPARLRVLRAGLRDVHRGPRAGLLREPGPVRRADPCRRRTAGPWAGLRDRRVRRRVAVRGSGRGGAAAHGAGADGGARPGQPLLAHLHAVDRRAGLLEGRPAARHADLGRGRGVPRRARRAVLRGLPVP